MSRISTITGGQRTNALSLASTLGRAPAIRVPSQFNGLMQGLAIAGQEIGASLLQRDQRMIQARRARQLTQFDTDTIAAIESATDVANEVEPQDAVTAFHEALAPMRDRLDDIEDPLVKEQAELRLARSIAIEEPRIRRAASARENDLGASHLDQFGKSLLNSASRDDFIPEEAIERYRSEATQFLGTLFTDDTLRESINRFGALAVQESFEHMMIVSPDSAIDLMNSGVAKAFLTERQRRASLESAGARQQEVHLRESRQAITEARNALGATLRLNDELFDPTEFTQATGAMAAEIASMPGVTDSLDAIKVKILKDTLRLTALRGEPHRFQAVVDAMPNTVEAALAVEQATITFNSAQTSNARQAKTEAQVETALAQKSSLPNTAAMQAAIDRDAAQFVADRLSSDAPPANAELKMEIVSRYGPTGLIPSQIVRTAESVVRNPTSYDATQITESVEFLNLLRTAAPFAYSRLGDDVRAFVLMYETTSVPGESAQSRANVVHEQMHPQNPARADEINARKRELKQWSESQFVSAAEDEFDLSLASDSTFNQVFGLDEELPRLRGDVLGDVVPFEIINTYQSQFLANMQAGMTKEAAFASAWSAMTRSVGVTQVFRTDPVIRSFPIETVYGRPDYGTAEIEIDLAARMAADHEAGSLIMPQVNGTPVEFPAIHGPFRALAPPSPIRDLLGVLARRKERNFGLVREWAREHIELVPHPMATLSTESGELRLYQPVFIDESGGRHPMMMKSSIAEDGTPSVGPYLLAPIGGLTDRMRQEQLSVDLEDARARRLRVIERSADPLHQTFPPFAPTFAPTRPGTPTRFR